MRLGTATTQSQLWPFLIYHSFNIVAYCSLSLTTKWLAQGICIPGEVSTTVSFRTYIRIYPIKIFPNNNNHKSQYHGVDNAYSMEHSTSSLWVLYQPFIPCKATCN